MFSYINIGPINVPSHWVFLLLSLIGGYIVLKLHLKTVSHSSRLLVDTIMNSLFIGFITWKLSYIIFFPKYIFVNFLSILYFDGGARGVILGFIFALIYLIREAKYKGIPLLLLVHLIFVSTLTTFTIYNGFYLMKDFSYYIVHFIFPIIILALIWKYKRRLVGKVSVIYNYVLFFSIGQIVLQFFYDSQPFLLSFSHEQVIWFMVSIFIMFLNRKEGV